MLRKKNIYQVKLFIKKILRKVLRLLLIVFNNQPKLKHLINDKIGRLPVLSRVLNRLKSIVQKDLLENRRNQQGSGSNMSVRAEEVFSDIQRVMNMNKSKK